jgi:hypothetical protein
LVEVVIQLREKALEKKTSIRAHVKKGCGFIKMADCSIVGLQESCYPLCARGLFSLKSKEKFTTQIQKNESDSFIPASQGVFNQT